MPKLFAIRDPRSMPYATLVRAEHAYHEAFSVLNTQVALEPRPSREPFSIIEPRSLLGSGAARWSRSVFEEVEVSPEALLSRELSEVLQVLRSEIGRRSHPVEPGGHRRSSSFLKVARTRATSSPKRHR